MAGTFPESDQAAMLGGMGNFGPLVSGTPYRPDIGLGGFPGMGGGGMMGIMAQLMLGPMIKQLMQSQGTLALGMGHDQNIYDMLRNQQFTQMSRDMMSAGAVGDRSNYMRTFRGMAALAGTPWGSEQYGAAQTLSNTIGMATPILAEIAPDFLDQLGGNRGSQAVMARRMAMGSRYALDPVTGRFGMSKNSAIAMQQQVYNDLYESGNLREMRGVRAGELGSLYDEMQRRGMVSGPRGSLDDRTNQAITDVLRSGTADDKLRIGQVVKDSGIGGLKPEALDKMRMDPAIDASMRSVNADRIKRSLKDYTDVVGAMRDIFGDMGRPNAPMQELLAGLEKLTQGGMTRVDPSQLSNIVRTTHQLARQTGVGMDTALMIQGDLGQRAMALGIDPMFATQSTQNALAFRGAWNATGGNDAHAWNLANADQLTQLKGRASVSAAASAQSNRLGMIMRMNDTTAGGFSKDSDAGRMADAIASGMTTWIDSKGKARDTFHMTAGEMTSIITADPNAKAAGIDSRTVHQMLGERTANAEYSFKYNTAEQAARQQSIETKNWTADKLRYFLEGKLAPLGKDRAHEVAAKLGTQMAEEMYNMSSSEMADKAGRNTRLGDFLKNNLSAADRTQLGALDNNQFYRATADLMPGMLDKALSYDHRFQAYGTNANMHALNNNQIQSKLKEAALQASHAVTVAKNMGPLRNSIMSAAVNALQDTKTEDLPQALAKTLGVSREDLGKDMVPAFDAFRKEKQALDDAWKKSMALPENERGAMQAELKERERALANSAGSLAAIAEDKKIDIRPTHATKGEAEYASRQMADLGTMTKDIDKLNDKDREKFLSSNKSNYYRDVVKETFAASDDISMKYIGSEKSVARMGAAGMRAFENMKKAKDELAGLAAQYAAGDMGDFMSGNFRGESATLRQDDRKSYDAVMRRREELLHTISNSTNTLGDGMTAEMKPNQTWADKEHLSGAQRSDLEAQRKRLLKIEDEDPQARAGRLLEGLGVKTDKLDTEVSRRAREGLGGAMVKPQQISMANQLIANIGELKGVAAEVAKVRGKSESTDQVFNEMSRSYEQDVRKKTMLGGDVDAAKADYFKKWGITNKDTQNAISMKMNMLSWAGMADLSDDENKRIDQITKGMQKVSMTNPEDRPGNQREIKISGTLTVKGDRGDISNGSALQDQPGH